MYLNKNFNTTIIAVMGKIVTENLIAKIKKFGKRCYTRLNFQIRLSPILSRKINRVHITIMMMMK